MAIKKIVTIWDDNKILKENINFLQTKTKAVTFPASDFIKNIIQDRVIPEIDYLHANYKNYFVIKILAIFTIL